MAEGRVSQEVVEVLGTVDADAEARVTQLVVEVLTYGEEIVEEFYAVLI